MSTSIDATSKTTLASNLKSTLAFTSVFPAVGAIGSISRNRGVKGAVNSLNLKGFKKLRGNLKTDVFTKGIKLQESYDVYKGVAKDAAKLSKKSSKGKIPFLQQCLNTFRKEGDKVTVNSINEAAKAANDKLDFVKKALDNGEVITKTANGEIIKTAANTAVKNTTIKNSVSSVFKSEFKNKFVLFITVLGALPRIKEEIIPAFKEKGFKEGIKTTGKVIARTGFDFVSNAGFSAAGRILGGALGTLFPGAGNAIGAMLGDAVGSCISMHLTDKIFDKKTTPEIQQTTTQQAPTQTDTYTYNNMDDSLTGDPEFDKRIYRAMTI